MAQTIQKSRSWLLMPLHHQAFAVAQRLLTCKQNGQCRNTSNLILQHWAYWLWVKAWKFWFCFKCSKHFHLASFSVFFFSRTSPNLHFSSRFHKNDFNSSLFTILKSFLLGLAFWAELAKNSKFRFFSLFCTWEGKQGNIAQIRDYN